MTFRTACSRVVPLFFVLALLLHVPAPAYAESEPESDGDIHQMLEQSLSITEIDKEIDRIRQEKIRLAAEMDKQTATMERLDQELKLKQDEVSKVLRAYYMGQRDTLLTALLSVNSISKLLAFFDYVQIILTHDKRILNDYKQNAADLQESYLKLEEQQAGLDEVESKLSQQRERVLALQSQLDEQLNGRPDEEQLRLMIEQLTTFWETAGLKEVEQYFNALSAAMQQLPDWVQDHKEFLSADGLRYTLRIPQDDLNAFLKEQNELFRSFAFQFKDGEISAEGTHNHIQINVTGHYTVTEEPRNGLLFHVDELLFNGFALPDTTRRELENKFDLGFYPGLILSFVKANSVTVKDGELIVELGMSW